MNEDFFKKFELNNCTIEQLIGTQYVDKIECETMMVQQQVVGGNTEIQNLRNTEDQIQEQVIDDIMYENHVFVRKYASYAKMKQLREQIWKCLATEDKEDAANLVDPKEKVQWVMIYGLLVVYKMIEDKKGAPTNFLKQMHCFFPELVPEPDERWVKSLSAELKLWRDASGVFLPFGQWSMNRNFYQDNKQRRVTAIAQHIKPFIAEAM